MLRWTSVSPQWSPSFSKDATSKFSLLLNSHKARLKSCVGRTRWPSHYCPQWQQSRLYAERLFIPSLFQQVTDPVQQSGLNSSERSGDLLDEAARYSIHDVKTLDIESAVTSKAGRMTRLVERPEYQFDYELWGVLLKYRMRVYGDRGIKAIWAFLTRHDRLRALPDYWPDEDFLWSIFVDLGLRDHEFLKRIAEHAKQLWRQRKIRRKSLYVEVIGGLLNSGNSAAGPAFSAIMHPGASITSEELLQLFIQASTSTNKSALDHFCLISDTVPSHRIYRNVISTLCEQERLREAMAMHSYLIGRHDYPTAFEDIEPLVRQFAHKDFDLSALIRPLENAGVSFSGRAHKLFDSVKRSNWGFAQEDIDLATRRIFGVKRATISDAFAARFFATKSFSFELALQGLYILGLEQLGPLSLREIALHAGNPTLIQQRLAKIDNMGIDTGGSVYARVIRQLLREQRDDILMDVVHCDQHPDVFGDQQVQLKLLASYHTSKDWRQLNRTLAILNAMGDSTFHSPNALLRGALERREWPEVMSIVARMQREGHPILPANIILMYKYIPHSRKPSERVDLKANEPDDVLLLTTLWQQSLNSGANIPPNAWREPLRRLGMVGRWNDLEKACGWLCSFYLPEDAALVPKSCSEDSAIPPLEPAGCTPPQPSVIDEIMSPALQRAIVEWGFVTGLRAQHDLVKHPAKIRVHLEAPWIRGLELLCSLRRQFGMHLHVPAIKAAVRERLRQLFSQGGRSKLWHNRLIRGRNTAKLHFYLGWINKVYGQVLFDEHDPRTKVDILARRRIRPRDTAKLLAVNIRATQGEGKQYFKATGMGERGDVYI